MFKKFVTTTVLMALTASSLAAAVPKLMRGTYQGNGRTESITGDSRYYGPIRFKVKADGTIKGTAAFSEGPTTVLLKITGKVGKITTGFGGYEQTAKIKGSISDGTKFSGTIKVSKLVPDTSVAKAKLVRKTGGFRGDMTALK